MVACAALGASAGFSAATAGATTQPASWTHLNANPSPGIRAGSAMAFDPVTNQLVVFSGTADGAHSKASTWVRTNGVWTHEHPATSPSGRATATMAWDAQTNQLLLFGGSTGIHMSDEINDTWVWTGSNWQQLFPTNVPVPSLGPVMAYDSATSQLVLYAEGQNIRGQVLDTMWTWNGSDWIQSLPLQMPTNRWGGAEMAYDTATSQLVLFGGYSGAIVHGKAVAIYLNDTWIWTGKTWVRQTPAKSPPASAWGSMATDPVTGNVTFFGGYNGVTATGQTYAQTWSWGGTTWSRIQTAIKPGARDFASAAADPSMNQLVLLGGYNKSSAAYLGDEWAFAG